MKKFLISIILILSLAFAANASDPVFTGIVSSKSFIGISSDLSNSVIYTPDSVGMFRVTLCVTGSTGLCNNVANSMTVAWTDELSNSQSTNLKTAAIPSVVLRSAASQSITISTNGIGGTSNVYAVVERLQ